MDERATTMTDTGARTDRPRPRPRPTPAVEVSAPPPSSPGRRPTSRWIAVVLAAVVLIGFVVVDIWLVGVHGDRRHAAHRHAAQQRAVEQARWQAVHAAERRLPAMLSYDYKNVDAYLRVAPTNTTGPFKKDFAQLITSVVGPAATQQHVSTKAQIKTVAVINAQADQVDLLVFLNQTTTSKTVKDGRVDGSRIKVTMARVGSTWLIAELTPV